MIYNRGRTVAALVIGGVAVAVALGIGAWKQLGVKSNAYPAGRVVRAGEHLCVLMQTCDPYMPSMKGVPEANKSYSYALWVMPRTGDGEVRVIKLSRGVASGARMHNLGAQQFEGGVLWLTIDRLQGVELASGRVTDAAPPASLVNAPISQLMGSGGNPLEELRAQNVTLTSGAGWLVFANEEEAATLLKPGTRVYENATAAATAGYKVRRLYTVTPEAGGVIPQVGSAKRVGDREFRRGAFVRSGKGGNVVRFSNPEGVLVVYEAGDPVHPTVQLSRMNMDGTIAWTADTKIGELSQVLMHDMLPAFVGQLPRELTEPVVSVVNLGDGVVKSRSLKGPVN